MERAMGIEPTFERWEVCFDVLYRDNFRIADYGLSRWRGGRYA
jgi:hypothetical protein